MSPSCRSSFTKTRMMVMMTLVMSTLMGCGGLQRTSLVKHPDSPMLIQDVRSGSVKVAVWDSATKTMVEYGWVSLSDFRGWTITKFDWSKVP